MQQTPSPNHGPRPADCPVDMLVIHYTGMKSAAAALERLCDPAAEVSAHYLIEEDGRVHLMVPENRRAWHAGVAFWRGESNINDRSIGIELVNPGHEFGYCAFPCAQMDALKALCWDIFTRHDIPVWNVVGHSDVAPKRKQDPGELFPWADMARVGIGLWPDAEEASLNVNETADETLMGIGYDITDLKAAITAFQRRFLPDHINGEADAITTERLAAVSAAYRTARGEAASAPSSPVGHLH